MCIIFEPKVIISTMEREDDAAQTTTSQMMHPVVEEMPFSSNARDISLSVIQSRSNRCSLVGYQVSKRQSCGKHVPINFIDWYLSSREVNDES
jgi:hypothetical protein